MSGKRKMSDVEYHESGQAKQDLYDELMKAKARIKLLEHCLKVARKKE